MCKHRKVFSLPVLTDERLTIGILLSNHVHVSAVCDSTILYSRLPSGKRNAINQSNIGPSILPGTWFSPGDDIRKDHLFPFRTQ